MSVRVSLVCLFLACASGGLRCQDGPAAILSPRYPLEDRELRVLLPEDAGGLSSTSIEDLGRPDRFLRLVLSRVGEVLGEGGRTEIVEEVTARSGADGGRRVGRSRWISVRGTAEERRRAQAILDRLLPARDVQIAAEFTIVQRPHTGDRSEVSVTVFDAASLAAIVASVREAQGAEILSTPSVTCLNGQRADISVTNQVSYLRDYEEEVAEGQVIVDPVVDVIEEGLLLDVTPVLDPIASELSLQAHLRIAELVRPIREYSTRIDGLEQNVTIQLPELNLQTWGTEDLVLAGGEMGFHVANIPLAASGAEGRGPRTLDVICRVQVVPALPGVAGRCRFSGQGLAVVDWEARTPLGPGDPLRFFEDGRECGVGEIFAVAPDGRSALVRMVGGEEPHPGATVR